MIYKEEIRNLFSVSDDYYLAHCISADFGMGKGIAVEFNKHFDMKTILQTKYPYYLSTWSGGDCILEGKVFNLVTKKQYFDKPTLVTMKDSLVRMKELSKTNGVSKIAMPTIGSGLDKLKWSYVSGEIKDVFKDTDIEILVCKLT